MLRDLLPLLCALAACGPSSVGRQFDGGVSVGGDQSGAPPDLAFIFNDNGDLAGTGGGDDAAPVAPDDLAGGADMALVCNPNDPPGCDQVGAAIETCRKDGSGYDYVGCPMNTICKMGQCLCTPGVIACQGNMVMMCGMDQALHLQQTCPMDTTCNAGRCDDLRCMDELVSINPLALPVDAWPRFRHDNRNTGWTPAVVADMPKMKWKVAIGGASLNNGGLGSGPVVNQNNVIFIGSGDKDGNGAGGSLKSLDAMGKLIFSFPASRGFDSSTPAVRADGTSYFSAQNSRLYAVDPMGKQQWSYATNSQADSDPVVTRDGILVYSSDDGSLYALTADGKLLWKSDPQTGPGEVDGGIAESCDGKIIVGGRNGWFALDAKTGKTLWKVAAGGATNAVLSSPVVTAGGTMYGFDSSGTGVAIDPMGNVIWTKNIAAGTFAGATPLKIGGTLYVHLSDGKIHAVDAKTGKAMWAQPAGAMSREIDAGPVSDGNQRMYFPGNDGFVYAFDTAGNLLWKLPSSGKNNPSMDVSGTIAIGHDGTIYVPGNDGSLYAYQ